MVMLGAARAARQRQRRQPGETNAQDDSTPPNMALQTLCKHCDPSLTLLQG
jgi:hypothetical protein